MIKNKSGVFRRTHEDCDASTSNRTIPVERTRSVIWSYKNVKENPRNIIVRTRSSVFSINGAKQKASKKKIDMESASESPLVKELPEPPKISITREKTKIQYINSKDTVSNLHAQVYSIINNPNNFTTEHTGLRNRYKKKYFSEKKHIPVLIRSEKGVQFEKKDLIICNDRFIQTDVDKLESRTTQTNLETTQSQLKFEQVVDILKATYLIASSIESEDYQSAIDFKNYLDKGSKKLQNFPKKAGCVLDLIKSRVIKDVNNNITCMPVKAFTPSQSRNIGIQCLLLQ